MVGKRRSSSNYCSHFGPVLLLLNYWEFFVIWPIDFQRWWWKKWGPSIGIGIKSELVDLSLLGLSKFLASKFSHFLPIFLNENTFFSSEDFWEISRYFRVELGVWEVGPEMLWLFSGKIGPNYVPRDFCHCRNYFWNLIELTKFWSGGLWKSRFIILRRGIRPPSRPFFWPRVGWVKSWEILPDFEVLLKIWDQNFFREFSASQG